MLAKTQIRLPSSDETSIDMFNETSDQTFNDSNENDNLFPLVTSFSKKYGNLFEWFSYQLDFEKSVQIVTNFA